MLVRYLTVFLMLFSINSFSAEKNSGTHPTIKSKATPTPKANPKASPAKVNQEAQLPKQFFSLVTETKLQSARQCMRGMAFLRIINGNEYFREVGAMSNAYFYGTLLSFAKNYCEGIVNTNSNDYFKVLNAPATKSSDTLSLMPPKDPKTHPLVANYSILFPLGMIESDGMIDEGRDLSAWNIDALSAETGLYQTSYDTYWNEEANKRNKDKKKVITTHIPQSVYEYLMSKYSRGEKTPDCLKELFSFKRKASSNSKDWGWGAGKKFQEIMKKCPALAADYQAYLQRVTFLVNGPVKRREAQPRNECVDILNSWASLLNKKSCTELNYFAQNFSTYPQANFDFESRKLPHLELARGPNPWISGATAQQNRELNPGWSYSPEVLTTYTLAPPYPDENNPPRKAIPVYSELSHIDRTIEYLDTKVLLLNKNLPADKASADKIRSEIEIAKSKTKALKVRRLEIANNPELIQIAIEKKDVDLAKADYAIQKLEKILDAHDVEDKSEVEEAKKSRAEGMLRFKEMREGIVKSRQQLVDELAKVKSKRL